MRQAKEQRLQMRADDDDLENVQIVKRKLNLGADAAAVKALLRAAAALPAGELRAIVFPDDEPTMSDVKPLANLLIEGQQKILEGIQGIHEELKANRKHEKQS